MRPGARLTALSLLCRCLSGAPLAAKGRHWRDTVRLADEHLLAPALFLSLSQIADQDLMPVSSRNDLKRAYRVNLARNIAFKHQALAAIRGLNRAGIEPLLMKGALYLLDGTLDDIGARVMTDLDFVIRPGQFDLAVKQLELDGYRAAESERFANMHYFELPMILPETPGAVELHKGFGSPAVARILPVAEGWRSSERLEVHGVVLHRLSPTHSVLHNIVHAQVQDMNHKVSGLPLRQLHTLATLNQAAGSLIDWAFVRARMEQHHLGAVYTRYIYAAHRLFSVPFPNGPQPDVWAVAGYVKCLGFMELPWLTDMRQNFHRSLDADYMEYLYGHRGSRPRLAMARTRHAAQALLQRPADVLPYLSRKTR